VGQRIYVEKVERILEEQGPGPAAELREAHRCLLPGHDGLA
jgi:hypothetical protein